MAEYHRKIELQSPDDLQYLIANVRRAANEKIDKDLPPIEGEDRMRTKVEEEVQNYIKTVFQTASTNLTINGLEPSPESINDMLSADPHSGRSVEEYEAFNPKLWEKAKEMARMEEDLIEEIAGLRRKMPGVAVENVKRGFEGVGKDEEILKRWEEREAEREGESMKLGKGGNVLGVGSLERQEDVEKNWQRGVEGLGRLRGSMPEMVARKERAERAEKHVLEMK